MASNDHKKTGSSNPPPVAFWKTTGGGAAQSFKKEKGTGCLLRLICSRRGVSPAAVLSAMNEADDSNRLHTPAMVEEVLRYLDPKPGDRIIDATVGGGGHAERILEHIMPGGTLIAIDVFRKQYEAEQTMSFAELFDSLADADTGTGGKGDAAD